MSHFVVRDKPPTFPEVVGLVSQSIIAVAVGTRENDSPRIVGTGFALEFSEYFATCWHVAQVHDQLSKLPAEEIKKQGLKDAKLRIALPAAGKYIWRELERFTWLRGMDEQADMCIFRLIGIAIPPLSLHNDEFLLGSEVGVIGFPLGNALQGKELRPLVIKTVLSGGIEPTPANGLTRGRIVLGASVAGGFSGGPVFSVIDGAVTGMVASKTLEPGDQGLWPAGLSLAVPPADMTRTLGSVVETTNRKIIESLSKLLASQDAAAT